VVSGTAGRSQTKPTGGGSNLSRGLPTERRFEPVIARGWGGKRHLLCLQGRQYSGQALQFSIVYAGACATSIVQASIFGVVTQQQSAEVPPASLRVGPTNDHKLLAIEALRLDPDPAVAWCVWSVGSLGDDAFKTQLAGVLAEARAVTGHMLVVPQPLDLLLEQPLEPLLALDERQLCRALTIEKAKNSS
jgi:hypothetical protein